MESETAKTLAAQRTTLAEMIVDCQYAAQPEIWKAYGEKGLEKSKRDMEYHLNYLAESIQANDPCIFSHYVDWLKILFKGLRFPEKVLPVMLDSMQCVLREKLPKEMASIVNEYVEAAASGLKRTTSTQAPFLLQKSPLWNLAKHYLDALLSGDKKRANRLILDTVQNGESVKNIYLQVLQPVQREIGRLWHLNKVSVAQEHFASAVTQLIMSQLYSQIFKTPKIGHRLVAACVSKELHEIGIRMVADFFEMSGWDTYYLGANLPPTTISNALKDYRADVLALSCTLPVHRGEIKNMIGHVRSFEAHKDTKIIVGGYAFNTIQDGWEQSGADGYAQDAEEAVRLASRLLDDNMASK
jgi:methanogenic corrinoid protein MtbC1